jgi:hypothetical protein
MEEGVPRKDQGQGRTLAKGEEPQNYSGSTPWDRGQVGEMEDHHRNQESLEGSRRADQMVKDPACRRERTVVRTLVPREVRDQGVCRRSVPSLRESNKDTEFP